MSLFLTIAFLFFIGSMAGWVIEVVFRRFFSSANPERKWINPGFLSGPYLPLYGFSLCVLFLLSLLEQYHTNREYGAQEGGAVRRDGGGGNAG